MASLHSLTSRDDERLEQIKFARDRVPGYLTHATEQRDLRDEKAQEPLDFNIYEFFEHAGLM